MPIDFSHNKIYTTNEMILLNNEKYFNNLKGCFSGFVNDTTGDAE